MLNILRQLIRDTQSQKLRTLLTLFGIIWGTAAISLLLAFGGGLQQQLIKSSAGIGNNVVIGWPARTSKPFEGLGKGRRIQLDDDDIRLIRQTAYGLGAVSGEYMKDMKLQYGAKVLSVSVSGVDSDFAAIRNLIPDAGGRFINTLDQEQKRRVTFLGDELAKQVFGDTPAVGQTVQLQGSPFLVIGVLKKKTQNSSYTGRDNGRVFIPAATFRALNGQRYVNNFVFMAADVATTDALKHDIARIMGAQHRYDPADTEAIGLWDTTQSGKFLQTFMGAFRIFLGIIGCLTMIVGGIGVSNIMNVVVEERTREIGVKLAVGAKPRFIQTQFLVETLTLTAVGGFLGFLITLGVMAVFPASLDEYVGTPEASPVTILTTTILLGIVGLVAGYFPARKASLLDPVVALKLS